MALDVLDLELRLKRLERMVGDALRLAREARRELVVVRNELENLKVTLLYQNKKYTDIHGETHGEKRER